MFFAEIRARVVGGHVVINLQSHVEVLNRLGGFLGPHKEQFVGEEASAYLYAWDFFCVWLAVSL